MTSLTNGSSAITTARPISQLTITFLRSQRSTSTPASGPKKNPGTMRAAMTSEIAPAPAPPPMVAAKRMIAEKPNQSPVAETTCTSQSRKNSWLPKRRTWKPGRSEGSFVKRVSVSSPKSEARLQPGMVASTSGPEASTGIASSGGSASSRGSGRCTAMRGA